jgi:hypothetical protein
MKKIFIASVFIFFLSAGAVSAHQPRIVSGNDPVQVQNPEISQAFYGEVNGAPQVYEFQTAGPVELYINLLVPKNTNPDGRYSAKVVFSNNIIGELKGDSAPWTEFFEEFGRDWYLQGPKLNMTLQKSGTYQIIVAGDKENVGKYVFVIGQKESFPLGETLNAVYAIPFLKLTFFHSPLWEFFISYFGIGLLAALAVIAGAIIFFVWLIKRRKKI